MLLEEVQTLYTPDKNFKSTVLNMLKVLKEAIDKDLKETKRLTYIHLYIYIHSYNVYLKRISKEMKIIKKGRK